MSFSFAGRQILLTGASSGIGRAMVDRLLARGVDRLGVVGRNAASLETLSAQAPKQIVPLPCDLTVLDGIEGLVDTVRTQLPALSALINNAGSQRLTQFVSEPTAGLAEGLKDEVALNFTAPMLLSGFLLPVLAQQESAIIINVTSGLVIAPKQSSPAYCASKAALSSFTRSLRYQCEAAAPNVRVLEALPPMVATPMTEGRGRGKISAEACAAAIITGAERGLAVNDIGKTKLLRAIHQLSPALACRIMRNG
jgi:uncharacterized oxidoreductase